MFWHNIWKKIQEFRHVDWERYSKLQETYACEIFTTYSGMYPAAFYAKHTKEEMDEIMREDMECIREILKRVEERETRHAAEGFGIVHLQIPAEQDAVQEKAFSYQEKNVIIGTF